MTQGHGGAMTRERRSKGDMLAALGATVPVRSRMIARNTMEYETDDSRVVTRLHDTDVVTVMPDRSIHINTGGWNTMVTRDRINTALPREYSVYTFRGILYLKTLRDTHVFARTVKIGPRGGVVADIRAGEAVGYDSVRARVDRYISEMRQGGIPESTQGDPFVAPNAKTGKYTHMDVMNWIDDPDTGKPYVFTTFVYHAIKWSSGSSDAAAAYWMNAFNKGHDRRFVCRRVRRYIRACLGYGSS